MSKNQIDVLNYEEWEDDLDQVKDDREYKRRDTKRYDKKKMKVSKARKRKQKARDEAFL